MNRPWGVHTIFDMICPGVSSGMPDGGYVMAIPAPYEGNRLVAAWWVLTGRAYAVQWPEHGDFERAFSQKH